jgi:hypothetical protein
MLPKQIDQFTATDEHGDGHVVRVLELYRFDDSGRWAKSGRVRFIVDDEYELEQDNSTCIELPGVGRLTRK